jgi:hypothetical protein
MKFAHFKLGRRHSCMDLRRLPIFPICYTKPAVACSSANMYELSIKGEEHWTQKGTA